MRKKFRLHSYHFYLAIYKKLLKTISLAYK